MNKLKLFLENFLIYGLGGIISKIIPLIMVPIVTYIMPNSTYFGISDLSNTVVQFSSALAIMGMYDAMYRMFFEKEDEQYKKTICSTAFLFTLATSGIVFVIMFVLKKYIAQLFFGDKELFYVVYISAIATLIGATNSIISAPTRMQNKRKVFLITNTVGPIISYAISIPMLLNGHYIIALPLAGAISSLIMEIAFGIMNKKWFMPSLFDKKLLGEMLTIAIPLLPNFLIYWVFNSCDKVMLTNLLDVGVTGVYSVASKFGNCSQLIYTAFAGGWQYFAFSTMKDENQVKSNSLVFEYLGVISYASVVCVCMGAYLFFKIVFSDEYLEGYIVAPYLFFAPLLQMLFQVEANQFLVVKKTWPNMLILSSGAIINVILNYCLIPILGIEGASIATLCGYVVSVIICTIVLCKMKLMVVTGQFIIATVIMIVFFVTWRLFGGNNIITGFALGIVALILFGIIYKKNIEDFIRMIKQGLKKKQGK